MTTFVERLHIALADRKAAGVSQNAVEAKAKLSPGYLVPIRKGERSPGFELVVSLADALDVRLEWLAAGRGVMRGPPDDVTQDMVSRARRAAVLLGYSADVIEAGASKAEATEDARAILRRIAVAELAPVAPANSQETGLRAEKPDAPQGTHDASFAALAKISKTKKPKGGDT